ncbi:helix-turn-helix transcriptional regulator [Nocardia wallacei]|uniref:helix-turn-helix transcriptional regulator n=1 Tax=Nocardia wallacei TaxID=480035 RepID=UPI00245658FC|nr:helix-turn-helix domain-containing protein [Nocardia wallacei]
MSDTLHTIPEALQRVPVSRAKLYQLIGSGEIQSVKVGTRRFIAGSQIDAYISRLVAQSASHAAPEATE